MCFSVCYLSDVSLLNELYWHLGDITMNMTLEYYFDHPHSASNCNLAIFPVRFALPSLFFPFHLVTIGQTVVLLGEYLSGSDLLLNGNLISK